MRCGGGHKIICEWKMESSLLIYADEIVLVAENESSLRIIIECVGLCVEERVWNWMHGRVRW